MKQFDIRNEDKKQTNERKSIHARAGQIRHCKLGMNIGSEEDGKEGFLRAILILGNIGKMLIVAPTSTNFKHTIDFGERDGIKIRSFVMLSQIRSIDSKRLIKHKYTIDHSELLIINKTLARFIC